MQKALFVVGVALCLGACASVGPAPRESKTSTPPGDTDVVKMASVNQWALDKGAIVMWIHYPTKASGSSDERAVAH